MKSLEGAALMALLVLFSFIANPTAAQNVTPLQFLIINNANPMPCPNITDPVLCNATTYCFAPVATNFCGNRPVINASSSVNVTVAFPWCHGSFPQPFIATLFFLCMLLVGFCAAGMTYTAYYHNTYTKVIDGERMYNLFFLKTRFIQVFLGTILFFCALLGLSAWVYFIMPDSCFYYYATILFLVFGLGIPGLLIVIYLVYLFIKWYLRVELVVNLEDYIMPTTREALPMLRNNVRCF